MLCRTEVLRRARPPTCSYYAKDWRGCTPRCFGGSKAATPSAMNTVGGCHLKNRTLAAAQLHRRACRTWTRRQASSKPHLRKLEPTWLRLANVRLAWHRLVLWNVLRLRKSCGQLFHNCALESFHGCVSAQRQVVQPLAVQRAVQPERWLSSRIHRLAVSRKC